MLMPAAGSPLPTSVIPNGTSTIVSPTTATVTIPSVTTVVQPPPPPPSQGSQRDTTLTKLFVGGLPYHTTDKSLREHFEVYGEIDEAVVITDRSTGKSRGYGFVIMQNKEDAERACKEPNPIIDGRKANVNLAVLGAKPRTTTLPGLSLGALRQYPTILQGHIGDFSALAAAGHIAAAPTAGAAALNAAVNSPTVSSASLGPGKARSSMSLQLMSGRLPHNSASTANPYLPSLYAASPYGLQANQGLISLAAQNPLSSTGNPLLDVYTNQYAQAVAAAAAAAYSNPVSIASAINGIDTTAQQAGITTPANYLQTGYAYAPLGQIQAAYGAAPAAVPVTGSQQSNVGGATAVASDGRLQ